MLCHSNPIVVWSHSPSQTYILGIEGTVAATAELMAALGAMEVHTSTPGQSVGELTLGTVYGEKQDWGCKLPYSKEFLCPDLS